MWINDATVKWELDECHSDIIFVLDETLKIFQGNSLLIKSCLALLSVLVGKMDIASGGTRVGLVTYSSAVNEQFNLNASSKVTSIENAIASLEYSSDRADTAAVLAHVRTVMLTAEAGDRSNVMNVVVVVTDGDSKDKEATKVGLCIPCDLVCILPTFYYITFM